MAENIVLVGGESLLGLEVREVLSESALGERLTLAAASEEDAGRLTESGGAAAFFAKVQSDDVTEAAAVVLAGSAESTQKALAAEPEGLIVDLVFATEDRADSHLRAPQTGDQTEDGGPQVVAHPAAIALALLLDRAATVAPIERAVVTAFLPASDRGREGIDELQQQAVNLFSMKPLPQDVFGGQSAFNLLSKAQEAEERIEKHLATLLGRSGAAPLPSLRVIQAPVFHGCAFSVWIRFETAPPVEELEESLANEWIDVRTEDVEPPDNVGIAGQRGIAVGMITADRNDASAVWMWAAADNLRLAADAAAMILAEEL